MSFPFRPSTAVPRLSQDAIDRDQVPGLVDVLFEHCREHRKLSRRILREQHELQASVSEDAWIAYLRVEEATNVRLDFMLAAVARWAFHEGRRSVTRG